MSASEDVFTAWQTEVEKLPYPVYLSEIPEDDALEYDSRGTMKPFIVLEFGGPVTSARDRGICSVRRDPQIVFLTVSAYAGRAEDARKIKAYINDTLLGFRAKDEMGNQISGELRFGGGMTYSRSSNSVRPTQYIESQSYQTITNLIVSV